MLMGDVMKTAAFSLAEAKFAMSGDVTQVVIQSVSKAQIKIRTKRDNVAGEFSKAGNRYDYIQNKRIYKKRFDRTCLSWGKSIL